jgi:coxsackievirus/adenovirus receptor
MTSGFNSDAEGWGAIDGSGNNVEVHYRKGKKALRLISDGIQDIFFVLPEKYLGDRRMSYMMMLSFELRFATDEPLSQRQGQDVIIESPVATVYATLNGLPTSNVQTFEIRMDESAFQPVDSTVKEFNMIEVLSSVVGIKIRASYVPSDSSSLLLYSFSMQTAVQGTNGTEAMNVEQCICPGGHTGMSCGFCLPGFKYERPDLDHYSKCIPCECNGHSNTCDPESGTCSGCMHNTEGDQCDKCKVGFYGDATQGSADDCQRCPCPYSNGPGQFGSACEVTPSNTVVCTSCFPGHTGPNCEICMDGYFGDPKGDRGNITGCSDCSCNGNIDLQATGNCDTETGECLKCIDNTGGRFCQICKEGYFGDAMVAKNCQRCNCVQSGTLPDNQCGHRTGICNCKSNVVGDDCGNCAPNHYGLESGFGCTPCDCYAMGSETLQCDDSGQCNCKPGVGGQKCDVCLDQFYDLTSTGCKACGCDPRGSVDLQCDNKTGDCLCEDRVIGKKCDQCSLGTQNLTDGCVECPECFKQVKGLYEQLTTLMSKLEGLLNGVPEVDTVSAANFDIELAKTKKDICKLLNDTRDAREIDEGLVIRLNMLDDLIADLSEQLAQMDTTLGTGEELGDIGRRTVATSKEVVKRIRMVIDNIKDRITSTAMNVLDEAKNSSDASQMQRERLEEIRLEAIEKASEQETEANEIKMNAESALDIAREANKIAKQAVDLQKLAVSAVQDLLGGIKNASSLAKEAELAIDRATSGSKNVLAVSQAVLNNAKAPLKDIGSKLLLKRAKEAVNNAKALVKKVDHLLTSNKDLIEFLRHAGNDVTQLINEGKKAQQEAALLLAMVNGAVMRVDEALESGRLTLSGAQDLLNNLKEIADALKMKREHLERALKTLEKAKSTNGENGELSQKSLSILADAQGNATEAVRIGKQAWELAEDVLKSATVQKKNADEALKSAEDVFEFFETLERDANRTLVRVRQLNEVVDKQTDRIKDAFMKANNSQQIAAGVDSEARALRQKVQDMNRLLENNGSLNTGLLNWIENQLRQLNDAVINFNLDAVLQGFAKRNDSQQEQIRQYTERITGLQAKVIELENNNASIPAPPACFNPPDGPGD